MFDVDYCNAKEIANTDLLERMKSDLDVFIKKMEKNESELGIPRVPDYDDGFVSGMDFVRRFIIEVIDQLKTEEDEKNVIFTYRGCRVKLDREKYKRTHLTAEHIDSCLRNKAGIHEMVGKDIDYDEIVQRYSVEEIEAIMDQAMDESIRLQEIDDNLAGEAFFQECVEFGEKLRRGEVGVDEMPATETGKKLSILTRALNHPEKGYYGLSNAVPIKREDIIDRANKRFDV